MGDVPPHSGSSSEYPGQEAPAGPQQPPQQYAGPQHPFSSQFDMAHPQGTTRANPYNMNAMMGALPQANYGRGQFAPGQPRFNPSATSQIQPVNQYGGLPNQQQYYLPPQAQLPQYYTAPVSPSQPQGSSIPARPNIGYYPAQMTMNSPQAQAYYYPQPAQYPTPAQGMTGQYMGSTPPDPRLAKPQGGEQPGSGPFTHGQDTIGGTIIIRVLQY
jgi:hypothetical protein